MYCDKISVADSLPIIRHVDYTMGTLILMVSNEKILF